MALVQAPPAKRAKSSVSVGSSSEGSPDDGPKLIFARSEYCSLSKCVAKMKLVDNTISSVALADAQTADMRDCIHILHMHPEARHDIVTSARSIVCKQWLDKLRGERFWGDCYCSIGKLPKYWLAGLVNSLPGSGFGVS